MLSLPPVQGRFPVGVTTFVTPVKPSRPVGPTRLKNPKDLKPGLTDYALQLEEVAFTAYYPADISNSPSKGVDWLPRPLGASVLGLSTYSGISTWLLGPAVYFFASLIRIPAYRNPPLLHPEKAENNSEKQWPLVIFSHGLGGSRTMYSQFCSRLAASGKIVLALEHRDGTGLACVPRSWKDGDKTPHRPIVYLRDEDICWDNDQSPGGPMPFRGQQLEFRRHEICIMYEAFRKFVDCDPQVEMETMDASSFDRTSWTALTSSKTSVIKHSEDVILTGHSFGGATALSLLATKPADNYERIPISKVIVLDPYLDPLPTPGPAPYSSPVDQWREDVASAGTSMLGSFEGTAVGDSDINLSRLNKYPYPKLFVINSEAFTIWTDHFARLREIVNTWEPQGRRLATLIGSQHASFSDFTILPGFRKEHDLPFHDTICRLSLAFIHDKLDEVLNEIPTTEMKIEVVERPDGGSKRKMVGNIGDVVIC